MDWEAVVKVLNACSEEQTAYHNEFRASGSESQREWSKQALVAALVFGGLARALEAGRIVHKHEMQKRVDPDRARKIGGRKP